MSEFKQLTATLARATEAVDALEAAFRSTPIDSRALELAQPTAADIATLVERLHGTFRPRALETHPDRAIYGENMRKRVLTVCADLDALVERWEALQPALDGARVSDQEAKRAEAAAQAAREAEAQRQREQAEAEAMRARATQQQADELEAARRAQEQAAAASAAASRIVAHAGAEIAPVVAPSLASTAATEVLAVYDEAPISVEAALEMLRASCSRDEYADACQHVTMLLSNIHSFPEESAFRSIKCRNATMQAHVASRTGGLQLLRALGFELRGLEEEDDPSLVLEEPEVAVDIERWASWFDELKANVGRLKAVLAELRVPELPTAVKGGIYAADGTNVRRPAGPAVAVLHGNTGGSM